MYVCICVCVCVCMYVCTYVRMVCVSVSWRYLVHAQEIQTADTVFCLGELARQLQPKTCFIKFSRVIPLV
jgi:hypothetical protein